ncbi:PspC domain-containing protein [Actinomadura sp. NAK00032]|uniref:PspC domain-containing protein n=1 Tax=Actinomadura sp. NAK00032 TaxID=2742128 RepID=UPI001591ACBD|nr:PspC domain-containing protein [Actinomadura sp. NAK00032]QKW33338.1 PspC domain-containing protein [Actinomadura sp. NAK00032]
MDMEKNTTTKKLQRTHDGRMVAGVCSGAAEYLGVDANILRIALAVFTVFGGAGLALYIIGWVLIPEEGAPTSIAEDLFKKAGDSPKVQDAVQKTKDAVNKNRTTV